MKKEQSNCWVNPVWWSPKGQDTLNLSWRSGLSRSRRDSCGAVFQKDKRANLGSSLVQWRVGYHGAVVHIPHSTFHIPHSTGDKTQFAYRAVRISRSNGVFKKRQYDDAVQLSGAKAFSLDWKLLIQKREFCWYRTHVRTTEFSIV